MTDITVKVWTEVTTSRVQPDQNLSLAVTSLMHQAGTRLSAGELLPEKVVYSSDSQPVENWQQRCVGTKAITVEASPPQPFNEWMQSMSQRMQTLELNNALRDEPRVRNAAALVLRVACGAETFQPSMSTRFTNLSMQHPSVEQLANAMGVAAWKLVEQADAILDQRNAVLHPGSLAALEQEVATVKRLITPAHRQEYAWECRIIEDYEKVKTAFADTFAKAP